MDKDEIKYAIAKQTASMEYIHTAYGDLELDIGLKEAVREAVERVLYKRLGERPIVDTLTVELAPTQRDGLDHGPNGGPDRKIR